MLVFSKTEGFRHGSIPAGIAAIQSLGAANGFTVDATEDNTAFNDANLSQYDAVIWLSTTADVLDDPEQAAFERYIEGGGGYVGIHAAADTEYGWSWYGGLVGAYFLSHPSGTPTATIKVADHVHPSTAGLPDRWTRTDEWYNYQSNPRGNVHVLATLDETTYTGGTMAPDHPTAWCHVYRGGRSWYTGGGHTDASYSEALFKQHLLGGIKWAAGVVQGDCGGTVWSRFQKVTLDDNTSDPFDVKPAPDGRVFFIERFGALKIWKPNTQQTVVAGTLAVNTTHEDGLLGLALDPSFATNNRVYLYYARTGSVPCGPANPGITTCGKNVVSRFTMNGDTLDLGSEVVLLEVETQRDQCCHAAGAMDFGSNGNLYISTGDNTNPFESNGYTPIDERPGRSAWDAQKSASNTNDLRGKLLRIHPEPGGTYTIPSGNLFAPGTAQTRPEIYAMGLRNPFRFDADPETGWVFLGDYSPDATAASPTRGPRGTVEWNVIKNATNLGWPYCTGPNTPYNDYDFATMTSGSAFNCAAPTNNSPNNTGLTNLPPAEGAEVWYTDAASTEFPELGTGCRCPMAGPMYHYDAASTSDRKFPQYYDDTPFFYEWGRNYIKEFRLDANRDLIKINSFTPNFSFIRPMDMEFGPDGALYVLEWGTGFGGGNADSGLYRIDYIKTDRAPIARATATPSSGPVPLAVAFSSAGSMDPDGDPITFAWDFQSNGSVDSTERNPSFTYTKAGNYTAKLTVKDSTGKTGVANVPVTAGNTAPAVTIQGPVDGGFFDFGDRIGYAVEVSDPQDGVIDCDRVVAQPALGHDTHAHPLDEVQGCEGAFTTLSDAGHGGTVNVFYVLEARYTDLGAKGVQPLIGRDLITLQPKRKQAEFYSSQSGITVQNTTDTGGGQNVTSVNNGDRISFTPMNLKNIGSVTYRFASQLTGGEIEVHVDSPTGPVISDSGLITPTGGAQTYKDVNVAITDPGGTHELFFVFVGPAQASNLFNLNWINFNGEGVALPDTGCALDGTQLNVIAPDGGSVTIGRNGTGLAVTGAGADPTCGGSTVNNVDTIKVYGGAGSEQVTLDLANGPLGPGATAESSGTSEIEIALALGGGADAVSVLGGNANDKVTAGVGGLNLNGDADADVVLATVENLTLNGGGGTDTLSAAGAQGTGGAYAKPVTLIGGTSHDVLTGGLAADVAQGGDGNDTFKTLSVADGADRFDGGTGSDAVSYGARVTAVRVSLDGAANDGASNGAEGDDIEADVEKVTGGRGDDSIDDGGQVVKNTFQGGPGADALNAADGVSKNDTVDGGTGTDACTADANDTVISCP